MSTVNALESTSGVKGQILDPNDPYGYQSMLPKGMTIKMLQDNAATAAADGQEKFGFRGVTSASDPLTAFLNKGIQETPEALKSSYGELFDSGNFGFRQPSAMGMDQATTGALSDKIKSGLTSKLGVAKSKLLNQSAADFAGRQQTYQGLADANVRNVMGVEAQSAAAREAAKQKKAALTSGLFGVAGAGAGAAVGGPAGAGVGGGIGSMVGSL